MDIFRKSVTGIDNMNCINIYVRDLYQFSQNFKNEKYNLDGIINKCLIKVYFLKLGYKYSKFIKKKHIEEFYPIFAKKIDKCDSDNIAQIIIDFANTISNG